MEYSLGLPGASLGKNEKRMRTQSYTSHLQDLSMLGNAPTPFITHQERRRPSKFSGGGSIGRKSRRKGQLSQLSTKDLGRWKPTDDLALILGVQQVNNHFIQKAVHNHDSIYFNVLSPWTWDKHKWIFIEHSKLHR